MDLSNIDVNDYLDSLDSAQETEQAYREAMIVEAAQSEADSSIITGDAVWFESVGPDAWNEQALDMIRRACYHHDAEELGKLILAAMDQYLVSYHLETIKDDWEAYVDG